MNYLRNLDRARAKFRSQVITPVEQYWLDRMMGAVYGDVEASQIRGSVLAILRNEDTGLELVIPGLNIVTNDGDLYYAERGALLTTGTPIAPVPTDFTDANGVPDMIFEIYDNTPANNAPAKTNDRSDLLGTLAPSSGKAKDATYPLVNDGDADNTGSGVDIVTYRVSYTTGEANQADNTDVILTNPSPAASENLINHAEFAASFTKTSSDTLKVFVNHEMLGV